MSESKILDSDKKAVQENDIEHGSHGVIDVDDGSSLGKGDILSREHTDPVLNAKMHLINNVSHRSNDGEVWLDTSDTLRILSCK